MTDQQMPNTKLLPTDAMIEAGADALKGLSVKDDEGWGWSLNKSERSEASRRVLSAAMQSATPNTVLQDDGLVERGRKQFARVGFGLLAHELCDALETKERQLRMAVEAIEHTLGGSLSLPRFAEDELRKALSAIKGTG